MQKKMQTRYVVDGFTFVVRQSAPVCDLCDDTGVLGAKRPTRITPEAAREWLAENRGCIGTLLYEAIAAGRRVDVVEDSAISEE